MNYRHACHAGNFAERPQDRLLACELEPAAASALARRMRGDARVKLVTIDGWTALSAYLPPKERPGAVLIDPPFEQPGGFARLAAGLAVAHRKWATGTYLAWYPIKDRGEVDVFCRKIVGTGIPKVLRAELAIGPEHAAARLAGTGLIMINPPGRSRPTSRCCCPRWPGCSGANARGCSGSTG